MLGWILGVEKSVYRSVLYNIFVATGLVLFGCFLTLFYVGAPMLVNKFANNINSNK